MRKRIGVFMGEVTQEQQEIILNAVFEKASCVNYDVFVFCNFGAYGDNVLHTQGQKNVVAVPDIAALDGIIVAEDTFDIEGMGAELRTYLKKTATCPVVYLRATYEEGYSVLVSDGEAIAEMTEHFIVHHGFRDICYMSGPYDSEDAMNRFKSFRKVMENAGIEVKEHMVFEGDYWRAKGKMAVDWFMEGRDAYPQAIICANDYMALSICEELQSRGVRIPEDVCVSGYDDILESRCYRPGLTSISVPFARMGEKAVEIIHNVNNHMHQERIEYLKPVFKCRKSCGCGEQGVGEDLSWLLTKNYYQGDDMKQVVFMNSEFQDTFEEEDYLRVAEKYLLNVRCEKAYLCICDRADEIEALANESEYTERMILKRIFTRGEKAVKCEIHFDRKELLPKAILKNEEAKGYLLFPLHYGNKCFGYMVFLFDKEWPYSYIQAYLMGLATAIEGANMHQELSSLEKIKNLYHKDPLTGLYNRRGFERHLRSLYERYEDENKYLSIASIDMNGLKHINDNYGHSEGDEALCRLGGVLEGLINNEEVCARTGGDEFLVVLYSDSRERDAKFIKEFMLAMQEEEKKMQKPYPFSASIGICGFREAEAVSLMACMQLADKRMYDQKRKTKENR